MLTELYNLVIRLYINYSFMVIILTFRLTQMNDFKILGVKKHFNTRLYVYICHIGCKVF